MGVLSDPPNHSALGSATGHPDIRDWGRHLKSPRWWIALEKAGAHSERLADLVHPDKQMGPNASASLELAHVLPAIGITKESGDRVVHDVAVEHCGGTWRLDEHCDWKAGPWREGPPMIHGQFVEQSHDRSGVLGLPSQEIVPGYAIHAVRLWCVRTSRERTYRMY